MLWGVHSRTVIGWGDDQVPSDETVCYLKVFKEDLRQCFPEVWWAEDRLDDNHSSVTWIHEQMSTNTAVTVQ